MAGTIIDSMVVTLGLDPRDFQKGERAATESLKRLQTNADSSGNSVQKSVGGISESFSGVGDAVAGAAGAVEKFIPIIAALTAVAAGSKIAFDAVRASVLSVAAVGRASNIIGISPQQLSGWQNAIRSVGGDPASITGDLRSSAMALEGARDFGQASGFTNAAQSLGIQMSNPEDGSPRSLADIYEDFATKFHNMNPQQAAYWGQIAGFSDDTTNLFQSQAGAQLAQTLKNMASVTPAEVKPAEDIQADLAQLDADQQRLTNTLVGTVTPKIASLTDALVALTNALNGNDPVPSLWPPRRCCRL